MSKEEYKVGEKQNSTPSEETVTSQEAENKTLEMHQESTVLDTEPLDEMETEENATDNWQSKYNELNKKYVLLYSDFDNYRKRSMKEKADMISTAGAGLMKDLLGVLDDFERAIANNEDAEEVAVLKEGFKLIYQKMTAVLTAKGLEPIEAKGTPFDADKHEAITQVPAPSEEERGKVIDVIERGYNLNGRMLRYAKVVVGQ